MVQNGFGKWLSKYQIHQNLSPTKLPTIQYVIAYFCHFSPSLTITNLFYSFSPSVNNDGQWSVGPVLDSFNIPLLYEQILKERRKELIEKYVHMANKVKEFQVINESLHHDLQVARINYQSLQEALRETHSLSGKTKLHELIHYLSNELGMKPSGCYYNYFHHVRSIYMYIRYMYMSHLHFLLYTRNNN